MMDLPEKKDQKGFRDRAAERREQYGQPENPPPLSEPRNPQKEQNISNKSDPPTLDVTSPIPSQKKQE